jgi:hypothetical protein
MHESKKSNVPKLTDEENNILIADFTKKEVCDAILQIKK